MSSGKWSVEHPTAVGLVRADVSGTRMTRHASMIRRHAHRLGYLYGYTVCPPVDDDPIGYALSVAAGFDADALVVYDLETVGHTPSRVCGMLDLETVSPPATWAVAVSGDADSAHAHPEHALTVESAHRIMQQHSGCRAFECQRKAAAYSFLVRAGKIVPPVASPRERAAARGLPFRLSRNAYGSMSEGVTLPTLLSVLAGLAELEGDADASAGTDRRADSAEAGSASRLP
ncbi:hypothetical protein J2W56_003912 [Nocardia kruczakiae]|uniref:Uncharacterized protein n=1 Tax=Nocardia kruczakiae TaxID=261477 RepID=A0ABU1XHZ5_9NOCA|nr:hypothetical protein [Nocardia kruczakiae]MDR7170161.1 hypothetical protein [Nocardia kruczakiae]